MRRALGLGMALCLCACTTETSNHSPLFAAEMERFDALVVDQASRVETNLSDSVDCVSDLVLVASGVEDATTRSVFTSIAQIYRVRVENLRGSGEELPAETEAWWSGQNVDASVAHAEQRIAELDDQTITENASECRQRIVDQMSEDEVTTMALNAVLRSTD